MSEIETTPIADVTSAGRVAVQGLEDLLGQHDNMEDKIRTKLDEFAVELQTCKSLRESSQA